MKPREVETCSCRQTHRCCLETGNLRRRRPRGMEYSDGHQRGRESSIARLGASAVILLARTGSAFVYPSTTGTLSQSTSPFLCSRSRVETTLHTLRLPRVALGETRNTYALAHAVCREVGCVDVHSRKVICTRERSTPEVSLAMRDGCESYQRDRHGVHFKM